MLFQVVPAICVMIPFVKLPWREGLLGPKVYVNQGPSSSLVLRVYIQAKRAKRGTGKDNLESNKDSARKSLLFPSLRLATTNSSSCYLMLLVVNIVRSPKKAS